MATPDENSALIGSGASSSGSSTGRRQREGHGGRATCSEANLLFLSRRQPQAVTAMLALEVVRVSVAPLRADGCCPGAWGRFERRPLCCPPLALSARSRATWASDWVPTRHVCARYGGVRASIRPCFPSRAQCLVSTGNQLELDVRRTRHRNAVAAVLEAALLGICWGAFPTRLLLSIPRLLGAALAAAYGVAFFEVRRTSAPLTLMQRWLFGRSRSGHTTAHVRARLGRRGGVDHGVTERRRAGPTRRRVETVRQRPLRA